MDARRHRLVQRRGWDRAAASYARCWAAPLQPAHAAVLDMARLAGSERVIDVACGSGEVTVPAAQSVGPSGSVLAVDLAPKMVTATVERVRSSTPASIEGRCAGAEDLDVDGPFDVALCSLGLMYVPDPRRAVDELHRVVRPGGRVVASVWGERSNCGWAGIFPIVDERVDTDVCPRFFALGARGALRALFDSAGFVDIVERRLSATLDFADDDSALEAAFVGGPVALAHARFDPDARRQAHDAYLASIEEFRATGGGYRIPGEFVVVAAHRPSTDDGRTGSDTIQTTQPHHQRRTTMTITDTPIDNGVDTAALLGAREALRVAPEAAEFTWRATCSWVHGTHSTSTVEGFAGLGQEHTHKTIFRFDADHPECFASQDLGATPVEHVLVGLASCLTAGVAAVAQHRQIQLRSVTATIEGDMNVLGILGADPEVRNGFGGIRVNFAIDADASEADIEALVAQSQKRSAVFDIVTNPTNVTVEVT